MVVATVQPKHDVSQHVEEERVIVDGLGARHRQLELAADVSSLDIQVVQHFDMVADEADRAKQRGLEPTRALGAQVVADVGSQPRIFRPSASALIHGRVRNRGPAKAGRYICLHHQPRALFKLLLVRVLLRHRDRNAMRGEHHARAIPHFRREPLEPRADTVGVRGNEERVIVPVGDVRDLDVVKALPREAAARLGDVLAILRAARVASMRCRNHANRAANPGARHLRQCVAQEWMPIAHPEIDRERMTGIGETPSEAVGLPLGQLGNRRSSADHFIVMRHFVDPPWRHAAAAEDVLEKGPHVRRRLRTTERDHEHGIERLRHDLAAIILAFTSSMVNPQSALHNQRPPIGNRQSQLPKPVWLLGWVSLVTDMATEMIYPLLPLFLTRVLGAGAMSLGLIEGFAEAANSVLKVAAGRLADRTGAPKRIVIVGYALSGLVRPLIAFVSSWTHVLGLRFVDRLGKGIRGAPRDAMLAHFAAPAIRGRAFGFHRAMDHAGAVIGPLIASLFLYFYPGEYRTLFALSIIPGIIVVLILLRVPDVRLRTYEPRLAEQPRGVEQPPVAEEPRASRRALRRAIFVVFLFSLGNASDAFLLLRLSDLGIAAFWVPLLWSALHIVKVASSVVGGDLSDRMGRRTLIAAGWVIYALVYAGFGLVDSPAALIAVFLVYGLYFGLTEGVEKAWIADLTPGSARGTAFGIYYAALGIGGLVASIMFGLIWTRVSPSAAFLTGAGLAVVATGLLYLLFSPAKNEEDSGHQR